MKSHQQNEISLFVIPLKIIKLKRNLKYFNQKFDEKLKY